MSEFGKPHGGRAWPVWVRVTVCFVAAPAYLIASVSAVQSMHAQITARFGQGWDSLATIGVAGFTPFAMALTGWVVDHLLTWSASRRLGNELTWYEDSWGLSWSWMKRRLSRMDAEEYATFEWRQLAVSFLFGLAIALFAPLVSFSAWWALVPVAVAAIGTYWAWFG